MNLTNLIYFPDEVIGGIKRNSFMKCIKEVNIDPKLDFCCENKRKIKNFRQETWLLSSNAKTKIEEEIKIARNSSRTPVTGPEIFLSVRKYIYKKRFWRRREPKGKHFVRITQEPSKNSYDILKLLDTKDIGKNQFQFQIIVAFKRWEWTRVNSVMWISVNAVCTAIANQKRKRL